MEERQQNEVIMTETCPLLPNDIINAVYIHNRSANNFILFHLIPGQTVLVAIISAAKVVTHRTVPMTAL